jgi:NAD(P)-dependent dehydrogenase (short-subunit alcohol dehydrogenase family)
MLPRRIMELGMDLGLAGKVVIVTGGRGAIGSAASNCFAAEGALVVVADKLTSVNDDEEQTKINSNGGQHFRYLDLADEASIGSFVDGVLRDFQAIDIIVNNAAVFYFEALEEWKGVRPLDDHLRVGLLGPVRLIQEVWRRSPRSKSGCIINVSSVAGHVGEPDAFAYTPVKAAQKGFTLSCAIEMAPHGGWAISVSPGHTWTPVHAERARQEGVDRSEYERSSANIASTMSGRFLEPYEVGEIIVVAASRIGKPLTGQDIRATFGIEAGGFNLSYRTNPNSAVEPG